MSDVITKKRLQKKTKSKQSRAGKNGRSTNTSSPTNGHMGPFYSSGPALNLKRVGQAKLVVGRANDPYEREADAVADSVTNGGPAPTVSTLQSGALEEPQAQTEEEPVQTEEEAAQPQKEEETSAQAQEEEPAQVQTDAEEPVHTEEEAAQPQKEEETSVQPQEEEPAQAQTEGEEPVQAEESESGPGSVSSTAADVSATIRNPGAGQPLDPGVRKNIEPRLGADLGGVRVHSGQRAQRAASSLGARAFTNNNNIFLNRNESATDLRLMAHESTHVVQQGAAAAVRLQPMPDVQMLPGVIMEGINSFSRHIPGYTLFTVVIGFNPLTGSRVNRNAMNLLEGLMGLVPFGTAIFDKLQEYGIIQSVFAWVEGQLNRLNLSMSRIERTLEAAWEDIRIFDGFDYNMQVLRRHFGGLYDDVVAFARTLVDHIIDLIKEAAIEVAEGLLAENRAYALIKKIIKYDPLRDETVEATTVEILEDFLILIGKEQELEQMRERGTLQETADWLDTQFATFMGLLSQLRGLFTAAWDAIQPENLPSLATNLQSLATQAFGFLQQVWDFAVTVASKVLELIKNALLSWLSGFAHEVPGFHLIAVLLGRNPFTQEPVPRTAENIIKGFITLLPGGEEKFQQMQETGTIPQAAQRIEGAMSELGITWEFIVGLFTELWDSLSINDLIDPIGAFQLIVDRFGEPIARLFTFIRIVVEEIIKLILELMNFPTDIIARIISNAMQAFEDIKRDPIGFLKNMLEAVKLGFSNFFDNILQHLLDGVTEWFFGQLRKAGIEPPSEITLSSVLDLVLNILGISMDRIWEKLAERIGQENVDRIRGAIDRLVGIWNFIRDVQERGIAAIWEYIESQISGLWDMLLEQATDWIVTCIIQQVTVRLLSMLDPTGIMAVVNSFIAFFNAVQSAIEYIREILMIVDDYVSTIAAVARGDVEPGAEKMEQGLANSIPVAVGFLANQVGLGNLAEKIAEIVGRIRGFVDQALDWLIDRAVSMVQSVLRAIGVGGDEEEDGEGGTLADTTLGERISFSAAGEQHSIWIAVNGRDINVMVASDNPKNLKVKIRSWIENIDSVPEENRNEARSLLTSTSQKLEITLNEAEEAKLAFDQTQNDSDEAAINNATQQDNETEDAERQLVVDLRRLFELFGEGAGGTNTPPVYGSLRQGFGTFAMVGYLKSPIGTHGSRPTVGNTQEFNDINLRREGGGSYYVKGHLLNENLGGPGNTWSNLTPITVKANSDHKTDFENPIKKAVSGKLSGYTDQTLGNVQGFSVHANYGRSLHPSVSILQNDDTDDIPPDIPPNTNLADLERLLIAEQFVPLSLTCHAEVTDEDGSRSTLNVDVDNDIKYGELRHYSLNPQPKENFVIADHINFGEQKTQAVQDLLVLSGIDQPKAERIYDAFINSGRIYNYKTQIGITKKALEKANPRYRISSGRYSPN